MHKVGHGRAQNGRMGGDMTVEESVRFSVGGLSSQRRILATCEDAEFYFSSTIGFGIPISIEHHTLLSLVKSCHRTHTDSALAA